MIAKCKMLWLNLVQLQCWLIHWRTIFFILRITCENGQDAILGIIILKVCLIGNENLVDTFVLSSIHWGGLIKKLIITFFFLISVV